MTSPEAIAARLSPTWLQRWSEAWALIGRKPPAALFEQLLAAYAAAHRRYHTLAHLDECLNCAALDAGLAQHPAEVALALWFHDAVYDLRGHDNEAASADWARAALREAGAPEAVCARVHALVMATRHDVPASTPDERLVVDIDLAILGATPARFAEYDAQIQAEYAHVPADLFRAKRRAVLQSFLDRPAIYGTPTYHARFEARARANLAGAIASLGEES